MSEQAPSAQRQPDPAPVLVERHGAVLQLTLNAPHKRNSLSAPGLSPALLAGLDLLESDASLRCAVLTGAGGSFCSGGDLQQLMNDDEATVRGRMAQNTWLYRRIALSDKLILAAVDGPAFGAGLGLAACCDLVVAGASSRFCCAFARVGAMPDAALFWSLPARVGVPLARRMMLMANELDGAAALEIGLADKFSRGSALEAALELAQELARGPARAYGRVKAGLRQAPMTLEQALAFQLDNAPGVFCSRDFREGAQAFFDKRSPVFTGE